MEINELMRLREAMAQALTILDRLTRPQVQENTLGFIGFVERENENLGTVLRDCMVQVKGQQIRISAPALVIGFLRLHSDLLCDMGTRFFAQPISKVSIHVASNSKE